jgi:hypothetical protein
MNGDAYEFKENQLNLIMFADAATYNKSGNRSMWAIFSSVVELPPSLRHQVENIIIHSTWSGSNPDFNLYLKEYNKELYTIINNGVMIKGCCYKFKVHIFIADAPARAKACDCSMFNGKYGCLKCCHPTIYTNNRTVYPKLNTVQNWEVIKRGKDGTIIKTDKPFKDLKSIKLRTKATYDQVKSLEPVIMEVLKWE